MTDITLDFGKYKGKKLSEVPLSYVEWLATIDKQDVAEAATAFIAAARQKESASLPLVSPSEASTMQGQYNVDWSLLLSDEERERYMHAIPMCINDGRVHVNDVAVYLGRSANVRAIRCLLEFHVKAPYEGEGVFRVGKTDNEQYIEAFKTFPSNQSLSIDEVDVLVRIPKLGYAAKVGDALVQQTARLPLEGRRLFAGHRYGKYRWIDLDENEIAEMKRLEGLPR